MIILFYHRVAQYYSTGIVAQDLKRALHRSDRFFDYKLIVDNDLFSISSITFSDICGSIDFIIIIYLTSTFLLLLEISVAKMKLMKKFLDKLSGNICKLISVLSYFLKLLTCPEFEEKPVQTNTPID